MYRIKSIFLSLAILYWFCLSLYTVFMGLSTAYWNIGLLLSGLLPLLFIVRLFVIKTARTSPDLKPLTFILVGAIALVFEQVLNDRPAQLALLLSGISLALWFAYVFWYSRFENRDSKKLKVGSKMPLLEFVGLDGKKVRTDSFKGKKLIYLFYRGNWCPLCMAQINEIAQQYQALNALNVEVLMISPQPHKFTINLARKRAVDFQFLMDEKSKVAKELDIFAQGGTPFGMEVLGYETDTVLPTIIITDENRRILFVDQTDNYRVRPEPQTFIKVLKENEM